MSRLAVLDLDGTLVDSLDDLLASVNHALRAVGLPPRSREEVHGFVGEGARVLLARAVAPHEQLVEPALAAWRPHYEAHCLDHTRAYPGIPALLAGRERHYRRLHGFGLKFGVFFQILDDLQDFAARERRFGRVDIGIAG